VTLSLGHPFLIKTKHFSFKSLLDQRFSTVQQHQWANKLLGFDLCIEYNPGVSNVVVDALSRCDMEEAATIMALLSPLFLLFDDMCHELMPE
jgi:hypothetical protein